MSVNELSISATQAFISGVRSQGRHTRTSLMALVLDASARHPGSAPSADSGAQRTGRADSIRFPSFFSATFGGRAACCPLPTTGSVHVDRKNSPVFAHLSLGRDRVAIA